MNNLADIARNKWPSILSKLGIPDASLTGKHGPCPICGGTDRFRFDDKDGRGTWFCNICRAGDGVSLLQKKHGWSFKEVADQVRPILGEAVETKRRQRPDRDDREACRQLWTRGRSLVPNDMASRYLSAGVPGATFGMGLRFLPDCRVTGVDGCSTLPAMLALVHAPDGHGASVHRTYLQGAAKASIDSPRRLMKGKIPRGSAIRLASPTEDGRLGVAEGIETALAVTRDFGIPCWSLISADMLRDFEWPQGLRELHIFADHDRNYAGQAAGYHLAHRAMTHRYPVLASVHLPSTPGEDWRDHGNARWIVDAA